MGFKIGDKVQWTSSAAGSTKTKAGVVVVVVPEERNPVACLPWEIESTHHQTGISSYTLPRYEESYLVSVPHPGKGKPVIYWPRTKGLRKVETQPDDFKEVS